MAAGERTGVVGGPGAGLTGRSNESGGSRREEAPTTISAYGCSGKAARRVCSSSAARRGTASCEATRSDSCWLAAGTPVMGSSRVFRWASVHEGEMRRSDDELGEVTSSGTSAALWRAMLGGLDGWTRAGVRLEAEAGRRSQERVQEVTCQALLARPLWTRPARAGGDWGGWAQRRGRGEYVDVPAARQACGFDGRARHHSRHTPLGQDVDDGALAVHARAAAAVVVVAVSCAMTCLVSSSARPPRAPSRRAPFSPPGALVRVAAARSAAHMNRARRGDGGRRPAAASPPGSGHAGPLKIPAAGDNHGTGSQLAGQTGQPRAFAGLVGATGTSGLWLAALQQLQPAHEHAPNPPRPLPPPRRSSQQPQAATVRPNVTRGGGRQIARQSVSALDPPAPPAHGDAVHGSCMSGLHDAKPCPTLCSPRSHASVAQDTASLGPPSPLRARLCASS